MSDEKNDWIPNPNFVDPENKVPGSGWVLTKDGWVARSQLPSSSEKYSDTPQERYYKAMEEFADPSKPYYGGGGGGGSDQVGTDVYHACYETRTRIQKAVIDKVITMARKDVDDLKALGRNYACFEGLRAEYNGQARVLERLISALENLDLDTIEA